MVNKNKKEYRGQQVKDLIIVKEEPKTNGQQVKDSIKPIKKTK